MPHEQQINDTEDPPRWRIWAQQERGSSQQIVFELSDGSRHERIISERDYSVDRVRAVAAEVVEESRTVDGSLAPLALSPPVSGADTT